MSGSHGANCCLSDRSFYERGTVIGTHVLGPAQGWAMPRHLKRDIHQIVVSVMTIPVMTLPTWITVA